MDLVSLLLAGSDPDCFLFQGVGQQEADQSDIV
jgi:hypothetical protein